MEEKSPLQMKVERMPEVKVRMRKVKGKDGKEWFVVETVITKFFSMNYLKKVLENGEEKRIKRIDEGFRI